MRLSPSSIAQPQSRRNGATFKQLSVGSINGFKHGKKTFLSSLTSTLTPSVSLIGAIPTFYNGLDLQCFLAAHV
jgi:hypothetical protein